MPETLSTQDKKINNLFISLFIISNSITVISLFLFLADDSFLVFAGEYLYILGLTLTTIGLISMTVITLKETFKS